MKMPDKSCIILGSNGYIGLHLANFLVSNGYKVQTDAHLKDSNFNLCDSSLSNQFDWNVDTVYLMAGRSGTKASFVDPSLYIRDNVNVLTNALGAIRTSGAKPRVIYPSTRLVYKGSSNILSEDAEKESRTLYSALKSCCESILEAYYFAFDIPYTVIRIGVPYGNMYGKPYSYGTIGIMANQALRDRRITLFGGGEILRTFTHINDLCYAMKLASESEGAFCKILNLPGENKTLREVAHMIAAKLGITVEKKEWPEEDLRIESGSTAFDDKELLKLTGLFRSYELSEWIDGAFSDELITTST